MHPRWVIAIALLLLTSLSGAPAHAWQEAREVSDEMRVTLDADGTASVQDLVRLWVVRGPLKWIDVASVDPSAILDSHVHVETDDGREVSAHVAHVTNSVRPARDPRERGNAVRVSFDDPRTVTRGFLTLDLHWKLDAIATHMLVRDGGTFRLTVATLAAVDGLDALRTIVDVPAAPDPPRPILAATGAIDDAVVSALRREPGRDVLELVRPHVARGEAATWTVRLDPRVLLRVPNGPPSADLQPDRLDDTADSRLLDEPDRVREAWLVVLIGALALAYGVLVAAKAKAYAAACFACGLQPRALVPLPGGWRGGFRAVTAALCLASGVASQAVLGCPTLGGLFVALAAIMASLRPPLPRAVARGPGRWLVLPPAQAFSDPVRPSHWLDCGTRAGLVTLLLCLSLFVVAVGVAWHRATNGAWNCVIDGVAVFPLLVTGCASQLPRSGSSSGASTLKRMFRKLVSTPSLRVAPWARVALNGVVDELRILVLPTTAIPGVVGIEIGLAWWATPVGWVANPEILVRIINGSAAATRFSQLTPHARGVTGRRPDEKVLRFAPRAPTPTATAALARELASALADRRAVGPAAEETGGGPKRPERAKQSERRRARGGGNALFARLATSPNALGSVGVVGPVPAPSPAPRGRGDDRPITTPVVGGRTC